MNEHVNPIFAGILNTFTMSYDHWKTTNPQDEELGSCPQPGQDDEPLQEELNETLDRLALSVADYKAFVAASRSMQLAREGVRKTP